MRSVIARRSQMQVLRRARLGAPWLGRRLSTKELRDALDRVRGETLVLEELEGVRIVQSQTVARHQRALDHLIRVPGVLEDLGAQLGELRVEPVIGKAEVRKVHAVRFGAR